MNDYNEASFSMLSSSKQGNHFTLIFLHYHQNASHIYSISSSPVAFSQDSISLVRTIATASLKQYSASGIYTFHPVCY